MTLAAVTGIDPDWLLKADDRDLATILKAVTRHNG